MSKTNRPQPIHYVTYLGVLQQCLLSQDWFCRQILLDHLCKFQMFVYQDDEIKKNVNVGKALCNQTIEQ